MFQVHIQHRAQIHLILDLEQVMLGANVQHR